MHRLHNGLTQHATRVANTGGQLVRKLSTIWPLCAMTKQQWLFVSAYFLVFILFHTTDWSYFFSFWAFQASWEQFFQRWVWNLHTKSISCWVALWLGCSFNIPYLKKKISMLPFFHINYFSGYGMESWVFFLFKCQ